MLHPGKKNEPTPLAFGSEQTFNEWSSLILSEGKAYEEWCLRLADPEHLGAANRANTLGRGPTVLHRDGLGAPHISRLPALNTVTRHDNLLAFDFWISLLLI